VAKHRHADPRRPWKGPWRWFAESLLDCCAPLATVKSEGITLNQVSNSAVSPPERNGIVQLPVDSYKQVLDVTQAACLARCNGAAVELFRNASLDEFRALVSECCSCAQRHILVSYSRKALNQTGVRIANDQAVHAELWLLVHGTTFLQAQ